MKNVIVGMGMLLCASGIALDQFPEGSFKGHGRWKSADGESGTYTLNTEIKGDLMSSKYQYDGKEEEWTFTAKFDKNSFFPVMVDGGEVGRGYCYSVQCHYEVRIGEMHLEETLTFDQGKLYRLGSKVTAGHRIAWEEALE